jgi:hypothetical protein
MRASADEFHDNFVSSLLAGCGQGIGSIIAHPSGCSAYPAHVLSTSDVAARSPFHEVSARRGGNGAVTFYDPTDRIFDHCCSSRPWMGGMPATGPLLDSAEWKCALFR